MTTPAPNPSADPADDRDPYDEGVDAHDSGRSDTANPYDLATDEAGHCSWMDGWNAAAEAATDDAMEPTR